MLGSLFPYKGLMNLLTCYLNFSSFSQPPFLYCWGSYLNFHFLILVVFSLISNKTRTSLFQVCNFLFFIVLSTEQNCSRYIFLPWGVPVRVSQNIILQITSFYFCAQWTKCMAFLYTFYWLYPHLSSTWCCGAPWHHLEHYFSVVGFIFHVFREVGLGKHVRILAHSNFWIRWV